MNHQLIMKQDPKLVQCNTFEGINQELVEGIYFPLTHEIVKDIFFFCRPPRWHSYLKIKIIITIQNFKFKKLKKTYIGFCEGLQKEGFFGGHFHIWQALKLARHNTNPTRGHISSSPLSNGLCLQTPTIHNVLQYKNVWLHHVLQNQKSPSFI